MMNTDPGNDSIITERVLQPLLFKSPEYTAFLQGPLSLFLWCWQPKIHDMVSSLQAAGLVQVESLFLALLSHWLSEHAGLRSPHSDAVSLPAYIHCTRCEKTHQIKCTICQIISLNSVASIFLFWS